MLSLIFLAIVLMFMMVPLVYATSTNNTSSSNHVKYCKTLKDKKTRSIICPDVYSGSETSFVPGG